MPFQTVTKEFSASTQKIQRATSLPDVALPIHFQEGYPLPPVPFISQQVRSYASAGYEIADDELGGRIRAVTARIRDRLNSAI